MTRRIGFFAIILAAVAVLPAGAEVNPSCLDTRAKTWRDATGVPDPAGDVRVYAIQFKQEIRHVETYATFRRKMTCLIEEFVLPTADLDGDRRADRTTIVVLNEDAGLATLATGTRGAAARAFATYGPKDPSSIPGAIGAFAMVGAGYARQVAYYAAKEPDTSPQRLILAAATDTFARGFMKVNSDLARRFGIYVVSSNNQPEFRETGDPAAMAALADPDLAADYATGRLATVFEAVDVGGSRGRGRAGIDVYNQAWMWAPVEGVTRFAQDRFGPINAPRSLSPQDPRANVIQVNRKTPLTSIEQEILDLTDDEDLTPANTGPFCLLPADDPGCRVRIGYGISLPAFQWGTDFGVPFVSDPCASPRTWMRCLDARGVNLLLQPEANGGGMWAEYHDAGWKPPAFQALSWLDSAWRAVADPTVGRIRYAITPFMVGNLVDVTFDGQSAIFERCLPRGYGTDTCDGNPARTHVGASEFVACPEVQIPENPPPTRCDDPRLKPYSGAKRETLALAPWVIEDCPLCLGPIADRERLAARARAMQAGTGSAVENDYLETAIWADLDFD